MGGTADFCAADFASGEYTIRKIVGVAKRQEVGGAPFRQAISIVQCRNRARLVPAYETETAAQQGWPKAIINVA
jgi:hypothetical protein